MLTVKCMEHLWSYGCLLLVDIFQFNNVYALTPDIEDVVASPDLQDECVRYVSSGTSPLNCLLTIQLSLVIDNHLHRYSNYIVPFDKARHYETGSPNTEPN